MWGGGDYQEWRPRCQLETEAASSHFMQDEVSSTAKIGQHLSSRPPFCPRRSPMGQPTTATHGGLSLPAANRAEAPHRTRHKQAALPSHRWGSPPLSRRPAAAAGCQTAQARRPPRTHHLPPSASLCACGCVCGGGSCDVTSGVATRLVHTLKLIVTHSQHRWQLVGERGVASQPGLPLERL